MIWNLIKICIVVGLFQGCWFYSMKGSLPAHIHSISLAPVTNESAEFAAAVILNEELNEMMMSENVLDIVLLVNLVLGGNEAGECSDVNADGTLNVLDVVLLVNLVLG